MLPPAATTDATLPMLLDAWRSLAQLDVQLATLAGFFGVAFGSPKPTIRASAAQALDWLVAYG